MTNERLEKRCGLCEYGDYDKQEKQEICLYLFNFEQFDITDEMREFIARFGCGTFEHVREGNPRLYKQTCNDCIGYDSHRIPAECDYKGHHVSEDRRLIGCEEFKRK